MEDTNIIALFFTRDDAAIRELNKSYKHACLNLAREITGNPLDAEECCNDTCLAVWNSIPPERPQSLRTYVLRICRNFALNRVRHERRSKRSAVLVELDECVDGIEDDHDPRELGKLIDSFLESMPKRDAVIFVRRYFYSEQVKSIAEKIGLNENQVSKILSRLRAKLKKQLEKGGIEV